jgi:CRP-like cAMP-binding protein
MKTLLSQNRFLSSLSVKLRETLDPLLEVSELHKGVPFGSSGLREDFIYFPLNCLCSMDIRMSDGFYAHLALLGYRDATGLHTLAAPPFVATTRVLASGYALRIPITEFVEELKISNELITAVQEAMSRLTGTLGHATACNLHHPLQKRLARWLLSAADASAQESFELTHEELACLLGVRREAVTESLARLSQAGAIQTTRGKISLCDPQILREAACECIEATLAAVPQAGRVASPNMRRSSRTATA